MRCRHPGARGRRDLRRRRSIRRAPPFTTRAARGTAIRCCRRSARQAVVVIDMNGNVVKRWDGFVNSAGGPARVFPGGLVMAANGTNPPRQESLELVGVTSKARCSGGSIATSRSRRATDNRSGRPASTTTGSAKTIRPVTTRRMPTLGRGGQHAGPDAHQPQQAEHRRRDARRRSPHRSVAEGRDRLGMGGGDHIEEFGFSPRPRAIKAASPPIPGGAAGAPAATPTPTPGARQLSTGSTSIPRRMSDRTAGSTRVISASRPTTSSSAAARPASLAIVGRDGKIVWRLGPDFSESKELQRDSPDHRPAPRAYHPEGPAWSRESDGVRQRRFERLRFAGRSHLTALPSTRDGHACSRSTR